MTDDDATWREHPDLLASMDALDAFELDDDDLIDTGEDYLEGYGAEATFTPMFQRPWTRWVSLLVAISMVGAVGYLGLRVILDWLAH